jgi:hypothetical protein
MQVQVVLHDSGSRVFVPGRLIEISKGGMSLYAAIPLQPGDSLEIECPPPYAPLRGIIRTRDGYCFGVEFEASLSIRAGVARRALASFKQKHEAFLRENEEEIVRMQKEVAALRRAARLAAEIKKLEGEQ